MLHIAVPNKGSLSEPAATLLTEAGYRTRRTGRELVLVDEAGGVELFFLRPRDIAVYVGQGTIHAGITGRDLLLDSGVDANFDFKAFYIWVVDKFLKSSLHFLCSL